MKRFKTRRQSAVQSPPDYRSGTGFLWKAVGKFRREIAEIILKQVKELAPKKALAQCTADGNADCKEVY